jgi:hypothetical protein
MKAMGRKIIKELVIPAPIFIGMNSGRNPDTILCVNTKTQTTLDSPACRQAGVFTGMTAYSFLK